ncbi:MAG TPA: molybdopterin-dependent oxidoreductase [Candidatus Dormibacteraeota bacterium]|jgi:DMSO/TMAO reductase YedYZ molybdopterin-dependent catalytic subunit|nr:molybdopterin-dependent oxidoreductase [Candidatus Dormibacteraeota bacterium]
MDDSEPLQPGDRRIGRRMFLALVGAGGAALAFGGQGLGALGRLPGVKGLVPDSGFYFYTVTNFEPAFDGSDWPLRIEGLVENPVTLTFAQLTGLAQSDQTHDYMCVTGWVVKRVRWQGPLVSTLLDLVKPTADARAVSFDSADGTYVDSLTLDEARNPQVLLAHRLNGAPLPQDRGAALRLVVPFMFGYKGVKWVSRIRLTAQQEVGYWEQRGYDVDAYLK